MCNIFLNLLLFIWILLHICTCLLSSSKIRQCFKRPNLRKKKITLESSQLLCTLFNLFPYQKLFSEVVLIRWCCALQYDRKVVESHIKKVNASIHMENFSRFCPQISFTKKKKKKKRVLFPQATTNVSFHLQCFFHNKWDRFLLHKFHTEFTTVAV